MYGVTGERIRQLRQGRGMTQTELGAAVGLSSTTINRYEVGKSIPTPATLWAIAAVLETSGDYLVGRIDAAHRE